MSEAGPPDFRFLPDESDDGWDDGTDVDGDASGRIPLGWGWKAAALAVAVALVGSGVYVQHQRGRTAARDVAAAQPSGTTTWTNPRPWPSSEGYCDAPLPQPVIAPATARSDRQVNVIVGARTWMRADLGDSGFDLLGALNPDGNRWLLDRRQVGPDTFFQVSECNLGTEVIRVDRTGIEHVALPDPVNQRLLDDGTGGLWAARFTSGGATLAEARLQVVLHRLDRPEEIPLASLMFPLALHASSVYAEQPQPGQPNRLAIYDLTRRRTVADLGPLYDAAASQRWLYWLPRRCTGGTSCRLDRIELRTGRRQEFSLRLPSTFRLSNLAASGDDALLAVQLRRTVADPAYQLPHVTPPSDLVVLDLARDRLVTVPTVEIPPTTAATYAFTGRTLVLAVGSGPRTNFYTWDLGDPAPRTTRFSLPGPPPTYLGPS